MCGHAYKMRQIDYNVVEFMNILSNWQLPFSRKVFDQLLPMYLLQSTFWAHGYRMFADNMNFFNKDFSTMGPWFK